MEERQVPTGLGASAARGERQGSVPLSFLIELVVQVLVEFVGEWLLQQSFRGASRTARSATGRLTVSALIGCAVGDAAWGDHLREATTWPRLLWVSLALAAVALVLAVGRQGAERQLRGTGRGLRVVREVVLPPWRWGAERLAGFALLNVGIAAGILAVQAPGRLL